MTTLENTPVLPRKYLASVYTTATSVRMHVAPYFHSYKLLHSSNSGIAVIARCVRVLVRIGSDFKISAFDAARCCCILAIIRHFCIWGNFVSCFFP